MRWTNCLLLGVLAVGVGGCEEITSASGATTCTVAASYDLGASVSGKLDDKDCKAPESSVAEGSVADPFQFTLTAQTGFQVGLTAGSGKDFILYSGTISAPVEVGGGEKPSFFLRAGTYTLIVAGSKSDYTFKTTVVASPTDCTSDVYTVIGVSLAGSITSSDCQGGIPSVKQDIYEFALKSGQTISVNASISKVGAVLIKTGEGSSPDLVNKPIPPGGGSTQFTFTAPSLAYYRLHLLCEVGTVGPCTYSASIQ